MPDVTLDLGNQYIGSAYSPQVAITETETGHEIEFTFADSEHPGQTKTEGFEVPNYSAEEAEREAAEAARAAAESVRAVAESSREVYEQQRKDRELNRVFNEQARANAEELREDAEQARAAAETARASAEGSRASAEQARTSAESARASAEEGRATAESARVSAEQARATAESARAAAESARVTAEQARQTDTAAAIARADDATAAANTATSNANAATTAAQAATGEAETATDAANAAAALATAAAETVTDAYFPSLTAGAAEGITGGGPTDTAAWTYRACPGTDGPATIESIHGRTAVWNQMVQLADQTTTSNGVTFVRSTDGALTVNGTATDNAYVILSRDFVQGHKYLIKGCPANGSASTYRSYVTGGSPAIFSAITDTGSGAIGTALSTGSTYYVLAYVSSGTTVTNLVFRPQLFDLTAMFGAGSEPSTVAEFEALYPEPYYPYDAGSLLSVQMEGIETVGFNQLDPANVQTDIFVNDGTGKIIAATNGQTAIVEVFPNTDYCLTYTGGNRCIIAGVDSMTPAVGDDARIIYGSSSRVSPKVFNSGDNRYIAASIATSAEPASDICINLHWSGYRDGEYEPYWKSERTIPAATYFPNGMRSAGTVYDELTSDAAVTRVGAVAMNSIEWSMASAGVFYVSEKQLPNLKANNSGICVSCAVYTPIASVGSASTMVSGPDMAISVSNTSNMRLYVKDTRYSTREEFNAATTDALIFYPLATPTVTPIDPPLNLTYRAAQGGTERITHTDPTAAPTLVVTYGSTADGIRDRALSAIAPVENGKASANYGVGAYLIHAGQLCRVTTAIATGETITIGTNVTATTVMAELLTLTQ